MLRLLLLLAALVIWTSHSDFVPKTTMAWTGSLGTVRLIQLKLENTLIGRQLRQERATRLRAALPPAANLPLQPVTNEHTNEHNNK